MEHYLPWHGHVTALSVAPQYRRLGLAKDLTQALERGCEDQNAWFVDLFVREGNDTATGLYKGMGYVERLPRASRASRSQASRYSVFRRVVEYYSDDPTGRKAGEDAFDMRKPLCRDKNLQHVRKNGENFRISPDDIYHG